VIIDLSMADIFIANMERHLILSAIFSKANGCTVDDALTHPLSKEDKGSDWRRFRFSDIGDSR
jgi:hypothetical protein